MVINRSSSSYFLFQYIHSLQFFGISVFKKYNCKWYENEMRELQNDYLFNRKKKQSTNCYHSNLTTTSSAKDFDNKDDHRWKWWLTTLTCCTSGLILLLCNVNVVDPSLVCRFCCHHIHTHIHTHTNNKLPRYLLFYTKNFYFLTEIL